MLTEVSLHFSLDWITIGGALFFNSTAASWHRLLHFMKTHLRKDAMQMAYPWARIIDDTYLMEFSAKQNFHLCAILAGILEIAQGNAGVWEANWVSTRLAEVEDAKLISRAFCEKFCMKLEDVVATSKSLGILNRAKEIKREVNEEEHKT
ncbi:hypothetical protein B5X24_HaOG214763 [Helicoverpa armigera]|uniref:Uncharacterized protein n=1 Tax=Helicoverpa armigera TaxID=29058 RepID=A0A2W1B4I5_HELAM|nr:hypothetical protein B5X24_HaOG214763 [Helicoverpa armigera]